MTRIENLFERIRRDGRPGLIPFVMAGDPSLDVTGELIIEFARAGATAVELGVPFSDPMADGPVIQRASERACLNKIGVEQILKLVAKVRTNTDIPVILFSYYNPLLQFGLEDLAERAGAVGVDAILVTDLPPEDSGVFASSLKRREMNLIYLVAPTTSDERLRKIAKQATGFLYAVSRNGVTGVRESMSTQTEILVERVRKVTDLPVAVGFGVSNRDQFREASRYAEAVVIGSAIVAEIEKHSGTKDLVESVGRFVQSLQANGDDSGRPTPMNDQKELLRDHVDMRMVVAEGGDPSADRNQIVQLDPDHPGFRDAGYRARRNEIAQIALRYQPGSPIPDAPYVAREHQLWKSIRETLAPQHQRHACREYLDCVTKVDLPVDRIPQLREVAKKIGQFSGFRLEPIAGLVEPRVFLESLADGVFLCTQYIRHDSTPLYTPEPDVVHEVLGHAVTLASERLAELNRLVGRAVKRTSSAEDLERLSRVYWFTLEFGVVREKGQIKAYGTGLLSSAGELEEMHKAKLLPFDLEAAAIHEYDPTHFQPELFCAESFDEMYETLRDYLVNWRG